MAQCLPAIVELDHMLDGWSKSVENLLIAAPYKPETRRGHGLSTGLM
jgi:hypothetical protein